MNVNMMYPTDSLSQWVPTPGAGYHPEFVYALHDFLPENVDQISFKAGDRIKVIKKDDRFEDGWWQVTPASLTRFTRASSTFSSNEVKTFKAVLASST